MQRTILHCDLNNFYASVECLYRPEIRHFPVAVCGSQEDRHGIVLAKNQIAKKFGVITGEPIWSAKDKCPNLVIAPPDFSKYIRFSAYAKEIYQNYTNQIESFGIDECWLDVSESIGLFGDGQTIADQIRHKIRQELGVTASVGVSFNKIFAKLGSDMKKPDATTVITEKTFRNKIWSLPVQELLYVGSSTKRKLNRVSIFTIGQLANASPEFLCGQLGKWGHTLWNFANGYDVSAVSPSNSQNIVKSIGNSLTSSYNLESNFDVRLLIQVLSESVSERLRKYGALGRTIQITIKDTNLSSFERQEKLSRPSCNTSDIVKTAYALFLKHWNWVSPVRSLGVRVADISFLDDYRQLSFIEDDIKYYKIQQLENSIDRIRERFGHYAVQRGLLIGKSPMLRNPVEENIIFPVSYFK